MRRSPSTLPQLITEGNFRVETKIKICDDLIFQIDVLKKSATRRNCFIDHVEGNILDENAEETCEFSSSKLLKCIFSSRTRGQNRRRKRFCSISISSRHLRGARSFFFRVSTLMSNWQFFSNGKIRSDLIRWLTFALLGSLADRPLFHRRLLCSFSSFSCRCHIDPVHS